MLLVDFIIRRLYEGAQCQVTPIGLSHNNPEMCIMNFQMPNAVCLFLSQAGRKDTRTFRSVSPCVMMRVSGGGTLFVFLFTQCGLIPLGPSALLWLSFIWLCLADCVSDGHTHHSSTHQEHRNSVEASVAVQKQSESSDFSLQLCAELSQIKTNVLQAETNKHLQDDRSHSCFCHFYIEYFLLFFSFLVLGPRRWLGNEGQ